MRAGDMVRYTYFGKEGVEFNILPSPVCLESKNFAIKLSLYKFLKIMKLLKHLGLVFDKIDPCKFTEIIYGTHIVLLSS